jgi:protein TonB
VVSVSAGGSAADVRVQESSGYACLDEAAVDAVKKWQFRPARRGDQAVEGKVEIPIHFVLEARHE